MPSRNTSRPSSPRARANPDLERRGSQEHRACEGPRRPSDGAPTLRGPRRRPSVERPDLGRRGVARCRDDRQRDGDVARARRAPRASMPRQEPRRRRRAERGGVRREASSFEEDGERGLDELAAPWRRGLVRARAPDPPPRRAARARRGLAVPRPRRSLRAPRPSSLRPPRDRSASAPGDGARARPAPPRARAPPRRAPHLSPLRRRRRSPRRRPRPTLLPPPQAKRPARDERAAPRAHRAATTAPPPRCARAEAGPARQVCNWARVARRVDDPSRRASTCAPREGLRGTSVTACRQAPASGVAIARHLHGRLRECRAELTLFLHLRRA